MNEERRHAVVPWRTPPKGMPAGTWRCTAPGCTWSGTLSEGIAHVVARQPDYRPWRAA